MTEKAMESNQPPFGQCAGISPRDDNAPQVDILPFERRLLRVNRRQTSPQYQVLSSHSSSSASPTHHYSMLHT